MKTLIAWLSFFAMLASFQFWLKDWALTALVMSAVVLHEFGHAIVLWSRGVQIGMIFVPFLAAAVYYTPEQAKKLNDFEDAITSLAGPLVNIGLAVLGAVLLAAGYEPKYTLAMISLNVGLAFFNLLPIPGLDGGRFQASIFKSLDESEDRQVVMIVSVLAVSFAVIMLLMGAYSVTYILVIFLTRMNSNKDNPADARSSKAMSRDTAFSLVRVYAVVLFVLMIANSAVPVWTEFFEIWPFYLIGK
ncbi:hypothetical protein C4561_04130 [candidate division WWE3 bacterium]|jgi:Zn-dependent protease|uniref:Peptidase M50 domain-containing protein n=1 Tax=candidate division WWE3 bacterium TaxID=2053526 RepID=A0A3A4ZJB2_UNCKA|nr:MAG: hypothetical protein C4561_04130 [candidate division WWE3 bacterium]